MAYSSPPPDEVTRAFGRVAGQLAVGPARMTTRDLDALRALGALAAEHGVSVGEAVELYLATTARQRTGNPDPKALAVEPDALLESLRRAVPALVEGYQSAGRTLIVQEETARLEFVDDLLRGDTDVASMVQRAEPFGLDLSASHQVVLAAPRSDHLPDPLDEATLTRAVIEQYGDRDVLVTSKAGYLVALVPARSSTSDVDAPARTLHAALTRSTPRKTWRIAVGRRYPGVHGVARSFQQAREAIDLAERLHPDSDMVQTRDLLIYRVLGRDRVALADLVESVLTPLTQARGGAQHLVETLEAYFASGEVATETARQLHVSVRTVTYRLARISQLTGYDPAVPTQRLTLHAAVVGARLLPWPVADDS